MFRLHMLDEVASTNEVIKRAIDAREPEGLAVLARRQTAGYGRQGRVWESPEGGMYLSVLLRPEAEPAQLPTFSLAVALACRAAFARFVPDEQADLLQVKWPNDVVLSKRRVGLACAGAPAGLRPAKLCGISLEARAGALCIGVGANIARPEGAFAPAGKNEPAFLRDVAPTATVEDAARAVLEELERVYAEWLRAGFGPMRDEFAAFSYLEGEMVEVENMDGSLAARGRVHGVDEFGRLLLSSGGDCASALVAVSSGEAHLRP